MHTDNGYETGESMVRRVFSHIIIIAVALILILGIPLLKNGRAVFGQKGPDAASAASETLAQPSGEFIVIINKERHADPEALAAWQDFFAGKEIGILFEDIVCTVPKGDPVSMEMARSFQSRLPENQMTVKEEDGVMMLSKAEYGKYDILILSKEMADLFTAQTLKADPDTIWIEVKGKQA